MAVAAAGAVATTIVTARVVRSFTRTVEAMLQQGAFVVAAAVEEGFVAGVTHSLKKASASRFPKKAPLSCRTLPRTTRPLISGW